MKLQTKTIAQTLMLCSVIGLVACGEDKTTEEKAPISSSNYIELIKTDLSPVRLGTLNLSTPFTGNIQAVNQSSVQAQVSATAMQVLVEVGQYVNKGQTLVHLNNQDNAARLAQAQANLASAKAQAELNRSVMQRKSNLLQQGFISKLEYEQSQLEYRAQQENVKAMQANVDIAQKAAQDTTITSPISGYITQRQVDAGQTVAIGQTLFEIVDSTRVEIKASIPASAQHTLSVGQKLNFNVQGNTEKFSAVVTRISPVANQINRNIEFFARPDVQNQQLSIGSFVDGQLIQSNAQSGQLIPLRALQNPKNQPYVWLVREQKLIKTPVEVLQIDERQELALISGLLPTDQVSLIKFTEKDVNKQVRLP